MCDESETLTNKELETIVLKINSMLITQEETIKKLLDSIESLKLEVVEAKKSSSDIMEFLEEVVCPKLPNLKM